MKRITKKEKKQEENNTIEQEFKEYKNITFDNELSKDNSFIEQANEGVFGLLYMRAIWPEQKQ